MNALHTNQQLCEPELQAVNAEQLEQLVLSLKNKRHDWRIKHNRNNLVGREFPSPTVMLQVLNLLKGALFPLRFGPSELRHNTEDHYVGYAIGQALNLLLIQTRLALCSQERYIELSLQDNGFNNHDIAELAQNIVQEFANQLPVIREELDLDIEAAYAGDPAALSVDEILLCYPGIQAIITHRIAHKLYRLGVPLLARMMSEQAHSATGIDIHPGAQIDIGFFIDHGTGVVIGETCRIGKNVRIYQAVTLGAKRFEVDEQGHLAKNYPRHPIIEDNVVIYAGATILGRITIGANSVIGGNVWLTHSVPADSHILQASNTLSSIQVPIKSAEPDTTVTSATTNTQPTNTLLNNESKTI